MAVQPKVSVIVPVYNGERYLPRCLESLRRQSLEEIEFLLVDDGSTDGSGEILDRAAADPRFRVVRQENAGVAAARYAGIQYARGEYVGFVDADDYAEPEMYEQLYRAAAEERADLAACWFWEIKGQLRTLRTPGAGVRVIERPDAPVEAYLQCAAKCPALWNKLYRRELALRAKKPLPLRIGEDMALCAALAPDVGRAVVLPEALYNYVIHPMSAYHRPKRMDAELSPLDNFLRNIAADPRYDMDAWKHLLAAQAFVSMFYTNCSYRQGTGHFYRQLKKFRSWPLFAGFCREAAAGRCLAPLRQVGALSGPLSLAMRAVFLLCRMRLDPLAAVLLAAVRRLLEVVQAMRLKGI